MRGSTKTYLHIVESFREGAKVRQRTMVNLGSVNEDNRKQLINIAQKLLRYCGNDTGDILEDGVHGLHELFRVDWGGPVVIAEVWRRLDGPKLIAKLEKEFRFKFKLEAI